MKTHALLLPLAALSVVLTTGLEAQTLNWVASGSPVARDGPAMAYDPVTKFIVMFGGVNPEQLALGDTWLWQGGWRSKAPETSPSPRGTAAMAFDGTNIVLFGGGGSTGYLNDTWTWDGRNWTEQTPPVSPSPRMSTMTYDGATGNVVLFGGIDDAGPLADTWTWNGTTKTWTQMNPVTSPAPRFAPTAYDESTQSLVLYGGNNINSTVVYNDTWIWNGANWIQRAPAVSPTARAEANMAYDPSIGMVVLFGGFAGSWENSLNDTWCGMGRTGNRSLPLLIHLIDTASA